VGLLLSRLLLFSVRSHNLQDKISGIEDATDDTSDSGGEMLNDDKKTEGNVLQSQE